MTTKVVTDKVRLSYCHVWEPYTNDPNQPAKYSTAILIPKSDKVTIKKIREAQAAALEAGIHTKFGGKPLKVWADTLHDGDEEADLERNPEYAGHWYMSVSSNTKPGVVDQNVNPIMDSTEVYSGCFARVSMNCYPYSVNGKKGVTFGLNHVQKLADGDFLGGRSRAEDDFDAVEYDDEAVI